MKKHPVLMRLLADLLCAGIGLCVFALFHHVLPRRQESLGIVIENPYRTEDKEAGDGDTGSLGLDPAMLTASAGISDSGTLSAAGSRKNSGGKNGNSKGGSALTEDGTEETAETADPGGVTAQAQEENTEEAPAGVTDALIAMEADYDWSAGVAKNDYGGYEFTLIASFHFPPSSQAMSGVERKPANRQPSTRWFGAASRIAEVVMR